MIYEFEIYQCHGQKLESISNDIYYNQVIKAYCCSYASNHFRCFPDTLHFPNRSTSVMNTCGIFTRINENQKQPVNVNNVNVDFLTKL